MLINSAFPFKSVISALLILSLIAPSLLVPPVAFASLGGGSDGSGGFGEGEGPDGGGSGPSSDGKDAAEGEAADSGKDAAAAADAAAADANAAAAAATANDPAAAAAAAADAQASADAAAEAAGKAQAAADKAGTAEAQASAQQAADAAEAAQKSADVAAAISDAAAKGIANSMDMSKSIDCGCVMGKSTGEYSTDDGIGKAVDAMAAAEAQAAAGLQAASAALGLGIADSFGFTGKAAPTNSVTDALSVAAAHPALMDQTPMAQQSYNMSAYSPVSMTTAVSQPTVTPNQSFSTANQTIDATSFSLGSFAPGLSANPTAPDPNEGRMGLATGRMAQISMTLQMELDKINPLNNFLNNTVVTPTQLAQIADLESKIAALDARAVAMVSPTVTNQAVASLAEAKSKEVSSIAADVKSMDALGFPSQAQDALDALDARADSYDSRMAAAQADAQVAQTEVDNASKVAALDVDVALGHTPSTPSMSATPVSGLESLGISLGLNPTAAATVADVVDAVISSIPGIATLSALSAYADASSRASMFSAQAQAEVDEAIGLGIADSFGFSPNSKSVESTAPAYGTEMDANEDYASAGITDPTGTIGGNSQVSTVSTAPSTAAQNAASMTAQATALGLQAIGIAMMDALGFMGFGFGVTGKAPSAASTAGKAPSTASPSTASVAATNATTPTSPHVSYSYNPVDNTVTISPTAQTAAHAVEGRFSPTASVADDAASQAGKTGMTGTAGALGKAADDVASPTGPTTGLADDAASQAGKTGMTGTAGNLGKAADDTVGPTGNTGMTGTAGNLGKAADDAASPSSPTAANDNTAAPSVPGVTMADSLVGPAAPSQASAAKSMAVALSMMQALATPAAIGRTTVDAMQSIAAAISRNADNVSPTSPTGIATRSADDVAPTAQAPAAPTAQAPAAPTASTQAPAVATNPSVAPTPVSVAPAVAVNTAQTPTTPSVTSVPSQTAPAATTPAAQSPTAQATTPAAPTAQAPTQATNPTQATPAAQSPTAQATTPAAPTAAAPTAQAPATAPSRGPVSEAVSSAVRGIANALNQLFGITPAASKPASTVNIANLEKTSATADFVGVVPDDSRFLSFEDTTTAVRALLRDLENKIKDLEAAKTPATLKNIIPKYSPATENNPTRHANTIAGEVAKDIPGFTVDTPISVADLKGPTGAALAKGFAQAEEGISLPDAEADKGVAAYAALPSVPTTLKNGVYAPTNPADQVTLDNIRNGSPTSVADATPAAAPRAPSIPQAIENVAQTAVDVAQYSPTVIAVKAAVGFVDQLVNPAPSATNPSANTPAVANPSVASPEVAAPRTKAAVTNVRQNLIVTTSVKGVDTRLVRIMEEAAKQFPLRVKLFSGQEGRAKGTHSHGNAVDVMIYDVAGNPIASYMVPETANVYALFAETARAVQMKMYPELNNKFVWGGAFTGMVKTPGGRGTYGGGDFMDFRVAGQISTDQMQAYKFGQGWQDGFHYYAAGDVLGIGPRAITPADYAKLEGFQLTPAQIASQISKSKAGAIQSRKKGATAQPFNAGLLGHKSIGPQQTVVVGVTVAEPTTPPAAQPANPTTVAAPAVTAQPSTQVTTPSAPAATTPATQSPATQATTPADPTVAAPITAQPPIQASTQPATQSTAAQPSTPSTPSSQVSQPSTSNNPSTPSASTPADTPATPGSNIGTPPDSLGTVGPGTTPSPTSLGVVGRAGLAVYASIAAIVAAIANVLSVDDSEDDSESEDTPENPNVTEVTNPLGVTPVGQTGPVGDSTNSGAQNPLSPNQTTYTGDITGLDLTASSSSKTIHVMIQVDGNTGDLYFDIQGIYTGDYYEDHSYEHEEEDPDEIDTEPDAPSIILDDQRLNVIYSDGTYAPVTINGVEYDLPPNTEYVYTVEYYLDGELLSVTENVDAIPKGNFVSNAINALFSDDDSYTTEDVSSVTRALIDPDTEVPADEYYVYRVYLKDGDIRSTTVPRYTSHRFMSERFAETGFSGNVLTLIGMSVQIPPPSSQGITSGIVKTLKSVGLSALDLFRGGENDGNPIVTDLGRLTPSDDGEINMNDIKSVIVLLDVEAECPAIPGLTRPYLYEIVIAGSAITGAGSDQAFRAVRCGGGDKQDFVEQVAGHFETFDGVGKLDRARLTEMIRFAAFKDLDMSRLVATTGENNTATSSPATAPETQPDDEEFVPNTTNEVVFEVKATGSQGQTLLDWSALNSIQVGAGVQLHFRWNGSAYQQCLPFLNDSGDYALTVSNRAMTRGDTESEGYDVRESSTVYRIECGGQRNNEFGVDTRDIEVIIE